MRQLLILAFYCEVYRREPRCRVYANDVLLDEFNLPHTIEKELFDPNNNNWKLDPKQNLEEFDSLFYKCIEFDNRDVKEMEIKIEVQNDDNNYTNGFMTKWTRIKMPYVCLLSKKLLSRINDLKNNWKFTKEKYHLRLKKNILQYYLGKRGRVYENFSSNLQLNFPDTVQNQIKVFHPGRHWIGSSGHYYVKLKRKLGLWLNESDRHKGFRTLGNSEFIEYIYDKYKQHEDQGSSNT